LWKDGSIRNPGYAYPEAKAEQITSGGIIGGIGVTPGASASGAGFNALQWNNGATTDLGRIGPGAGDLGLPAASVSGLQTNSVLAWVHSETDRYTSQIWLNGAKHQISGLTADNDAQATAMNDGQQVVGASLIHRGQHNLYHAFVWQNGTTRDLGVLQEWTCDLNSDYPNCGDSRASDINDHGAVVGTSWDSNFRQHAVQWVDGTIRDLGLGVALTINNAGDIAGNTDNPSTAAMGDGGVGLFWHNGTRTEIRGPGGATVVVGMNGQSTLVGTFLGSDGRPHVFVWKPGQSQPTDLGTGPSDTPGVGTIGVAINERGDVIGYTCDRYTGDGSCSLDAKTHAILWRHK